MRYSLKQTDSNKMEWYTGTFSCFGLKSSSDKKRRSANLTPTICLQNVKNENGDIVADHLWFNYTSPFYSQGKVHPGDSFTFSQILSII